MNILKQIALLFAICILGEFISRGLPFLIPASIAGMAVLFCLMVSKIIKKDSIKEVSGFLLDNMSLLFIPAGIAVAEYFGIIQKVWFQILMVIGITTILTFGCTAFAVKLTISIMNKRSNRNE